MEKYIVASNIFELNFWFQMVSDGIKTVAPRLLGGLLPGRKAEELFRGGTGLEEKRTRDSGRLATKMVG